MWEVAVGFWPTDTVDPNKRKLNSGNISGVFRKADFANGRNTIGRDSGIIATLLFAFYTSEKEKLMITFRLLSVFFLLVFFACSGYSDAELEKIVISNQALSEILRSWRSDSLGCQGIRENVDTEELLSFLNESNLDSTQVFQLLGSPNSITIKGNRLLRVRAFDYNIDPPCSKGQVIDSLPRTYCWLSVLYGELPIWGSFSSEATVICY